LGTPGRTPRSGTDLRKSAEEEATAALKKSRPSNRPQACLFRSDRPARKPLQNGPDLPVAAEGNPARPRASDYDLAGWARSLPRVEAFSLLPANAGNLASLLKKAFLPRTIFRTRVTRR